MTDQRELFDKAKAIEARDKGMDLAKANRAITLDRCRNIAKMLAETQRTPISADDVYETHIEIYGYIPELGGAAGSLFKKSQWTFARWVQSKRVSNHGRWIRSWWLKP